VVEVPRGAAGDRQLGLDDGGGRPAQDGRPIEANHLLRLLAEESRAEYDALLPRLEPVALPRDAVLYEPDVPLSHVHFPRTGVSSIVKVMANGRRVEVGTTGNEGMVGVPVFLNAATTPFQCFMQVAGAGWRLDVHSFRAAAAPGRALHRIMERYAQYLYDQAAQLVACNRLHGVEERCARWLLMTHDRVGRAERFPLTHEFLAIMLGVRRASVSVAAEALQRAGVIQYRRGNVAVVDRPGLEAASCECYHTDSADYHRLLGASAARAS
jgi:CRP-like cAMP-binding protein